MKLLLVIVRQICFVAAPITEILASARLNKLSILCVNDL